MKKRMINKQAIFLNQSFWIMSFTQQYLKINTIILFAWDNTGKTILLEHVRKLKDEKESLDWIFHSGLGMEQPCCPQESHTNVKPAVLRAALGSRNSDPWIDGICPVSQCHLPPCPGVCEESIPPSCNWHRRKGKLVKTCRKEALTVIPLPCTVSQLALLEWTPGKSTIYTLDLLDNHHITLLTPAKPPLP